jgi:transposase
MLNRAVERVGENMEDALIFLRDSLFSMYEFEHTDVNIDSTSVSVYSKQTDLFRFGYSRDKRPDLRQVNVCVTELREPINMPMHMTVESGSNTDPAIFLRSVSDIIDELRDNSLFVFDAGGDSKNVSDLILSKGKRYIVRKRMNISDDIWISKFDKNKAECVDADEGIYCNAKHSHHPEERSICSFLRSYTQTRWIFSICRHRSASMTRTRSCVENVTER